jgi:hypothetical protein
MGKDSVQKQNEARLPVGQTKPNKWKSRSGLLLASLFIVLAGAYSGFYFALPKQGQIGPSGAVSGQSEKIPPPPEQDVKTFRDRAEGIIEKNETKDPYAQGTHKLIREGGPSQTAYLVSSVVDLDAYLGKKVEVWGETQASTKVGWLMDVGKVNILE